MSDKKSLDKKADDKPSPKPRLPTPYNIFIQRFSVPPGADPKDRMRLGADAWKNLSEDEKKNYGPSEDDRRKHSEKMIIWQTATSTATDSVPAEVTVKKPRKSSKKASAEVAPEVVPVTTIPVITFPVATIPVATIPEVVPEVAPVVTIPEKKVRSKKAKPVVAAPPTEVSGPRASSSEAPLTADTAHSADTTTRIADTTTRIAVDIDLKSTVDTAVGDAGEEVDTYTLDSPVAAPAPKKGGPRKTGGSKNKK